MPAAKGLMAFDPMGAGLVESLGRPGGKPMSLIVRDEKNGSCSSAEAENGHGFSVPKVTEQTISTINALQR
jgi:hypothetical protein